MRRPLAEAGKVEPDSGIFTTSSPRWGVFYELVLVVERRGVGLDYLVRQVIIGKMGLKGPDNDGQIGFDAA